MFYFLPRELKHATGMLVVALATTAAPQAKATAVSGQGTWETTLQSRDLDGDLSNGPEAFFDAVLNVTWLADANFARTSGYTSAANGGVPRGSEFGTNVIWTDGSMGWDAANTWAANLNVNGLTGWRLPTMVDTGPLGCNRAFSGTDCGYNVSTSTSELAHMYQVTLRNLAYYDPSGNGPQSGWGLTNTGPFSNLQSSRYWYGVAYTPPANDPWSINDAWIFLSENGHQLDSEKANGFYAWAVRSGDVATAVPEPQTYALALAGLAVAVRAAKRRKR